MGPQGTCRMVTSAPMFGSNDIDKAKAFYDAVLATIGVAGILEHGSGGRVYGNAQGQPVFSVVRPFDGQPATAGNGTMASFLCDAREQVDATHAKALALGGR